MSDDRRPPADQPDGEGTRNEQARGGSGELSAELREMGQQLEAAFRAALESERTKQLQRDLAGGVRELSQQIQAALKALSPDNILHQVMTDYENERDDLRFCR